MTARETTEIGLRLGGKIFTHWREVEIFRSMEALCGSFTLKLADRQPDGGYAREIKPGAGCTLSIDNKVIMTGWVDDVEPGYDKGSHLVTIKGRDKTCDLVDCSVVPPPAVWLGADLLQIARDVCGPFKIGVSSDVDVSRLKNKEQIQPGETVFELLERLARLYSVVMISDGRGNVQFTRAGSAGSQSPLILGETIERAQGRYSARQRFSKYFVFGQRAVGAPLSLQDMASAHGEASDPGVGRYRPLIIVDPYQDLDGVYFGQRAIWEAAVRSGRACRATITQPTFYDANGSLWEINRMVPVKDLFLGIDEALLIVGVRFTASLQSGTQTEITVTKRSAFELAPLSPGTNLVFTNRDNTDR